MSQSTPAPRTPAKPRKRRRKGMPAGKPKAIRVTAAARLARKDPANRECKRLPAGMPKPVLLAAHQAKMAAKAAARRQQVAGRQAGWRSFL